MGIIFNKDGTVTRTQDAVKDIQEKLGQQLQNYDSHLNCGFEELRTYRDD